MHVVLLIIQIIFTLVIISLLAGCLYIIVLMVGQTNDGLSMTAFFLNCWFGIKVFVKWVLGITAIIVIIWSCKFIFQTPTVNRILKTENGSFLLSDTLMVCESTDSTRFFTIRSETQSKPGRLQRCMKCNRIYIQHIKWLSPEERRLKEINDEITNEIIQGLAVDPV